MSTRRTARRYLDAELFTRIAALPLFARRPMSGAVSGRHRSPHRGSSVEFAEYRKYVPGDDLRRLDWRAFGRSDRFYIKEFEADTNLRLVLVVDASGSMRFAADRESKYDRAARMGVALAQLALRQGDAVGALVASEKGPAYVPPRRKPSHLIALHDTLQGVKPAGHTALTATLHDVAERVAQRAQIVVLSDLFTPVDELKEALQHLRYRRHDVVLFQLLARAELDFAFERPTRFVDLEGGASILTDPASVADRYREALDAYRGALRDAVSSSDTEHRVALLDEPAERVLADWLVSRAQLGRRRS